MLKLSSTAAYEYYGILMSPIIGSHCNTYYLPDNIAPPPPAKTGKMLSTRHKLNDFDGVIFIVLAFGVRVFLHKNASSWPNTSYLYLWLPVLKVKEFLTRLDQSNVLDWKVSSILLKT